MSRTILNYVLIAATSTAAFAGSYVGPESTKEQHNSHKGVHNPHPAQYVEMDRHSGGPDPFGYIYKDSQEADGPEYNWLEISGSGVEVIMSDDDSAGPFALPWSFEFYGQSYDEVWICSNGYLQFGSGSDEFDNEALPNPIVPNNLIALFWDDLNPSSGGSVYYGQSGTNWVCQFEDVREYGSAGTIKAQVVLSESGEILLQYADLGNAIDLNGESIGIENQDGSTGLQISLDSSPAAYPFDNLSIRISQLDPDANLGGFIRTAGELMPVEGAIVRFGSLVTQSAADGSYAFSEIWSGNYDVHIMADGFFDHHEEALLIAPGSNMYHAELDSSGFPAGLVGYWTFDENADPLAATVGQNLVLEGNHTIISGPEPGNEALSIGVGSYYHCYHDIEANGALPNPAWVNQFTIVMDIRLPDANLWQSLYQTNYSNSNDGDCFINGSANMGVSTTGYGDYQFNSNEWYRVAINADLGIAYDYYMDGQLLHLGGSQSFEGRFSLYPATGANDVLFFADDDGEDTSIDVAGIWLFDRSLNAEELASMGGYGHEFESPELPYMQTYLQSPTPTSIYVNWHNSLSSESIVNYGVTESLGFTVVGDAHTFDANTIWHRAQLTGLQADTEYYYSCVTDTAISPVKTFRTFPENDVSQGHFRIGILGDTRTDAGAHQMVIDAMREKVENLYGTDVHNQLNLVLNVGDIVTSGPVLGQYTNEYFEPINGLSENVPFMVSIGNHEAEAAHYYNYMDYEDFAGPEGEIYYSFRVGPILFLSINSNTQGNIQLDWVADECAIAQADPGIDWIVTFCHHPGRSEVWPDGNTSWVNNQLIPVLADYDKVCGLYYGHSHNYEMGANPDSPFRIMLSGGGGSALDRWGMYANQTDYPELYKSWDHYGYTIIDFDLANRSYTGKSYTLGHANLSRENELIDEFYQKRENTSAPVTPECLYPTTEADLPLTLVASPYVGIEEIMSSHFQLSATPGDYTNPLVDSRRDWINIYGDSGTPDYNFLDLNEGIILNRLTISSGISYGQTLGWRIRYRDQNLAWSEWSNEQTFIVSVVTPSADFTADVQTGSSPLTVQFSDLSMPLANSWSWDLDGDGLEDSSEQDPVFVYENSGFYDVTLSVEGSGGPQTITQQDYIEVAFEVPLVDIEFAGALIWLSWEAQVGISNYKVYSAADAYGDFILDENGVFNENSWTAPVNGSQRFYRVTAILE
jgi:hypothetical protein